MTSQRLSGSHAPCGWFAYSEQGALVAVNEELARWVGRTSDALIGADVRSLFTPTSALYFYLQVAPAIAREGRADEVYLSLRTRDEGELPVLFNAVRDAEATPPTTEAIIVVIRDRKLFEDVFQRLRKSADMAPGAIFQLMIRADGTSCMPYASEGLFAMYGVRPSQAQTSAEPLVEAIHPDDRAGFRDAARASLTTLGELWHEHRVALPGSGVAWREIHAKPERMGDGAVMFHGYVVDTSSRKEMESALAEKASIERVSRAKSDFLASMSHELRTPLNAVLGLSEALQEDVYGALNARQRGAIGRIEESGRHLLSLINDVLDVAKVEAGKLELDAAPTDAAELCRASIRLVQEAARAKQQRLDFEVDPDVNVIVVDERRMKQVLVNLLANAVKFTPPRGSVRVTIEKGEARADARVVVSDTGRGLDQASIARLFQPFVQIDNRLAREHGGTGLGLVLVRRLVELHGGSVRVESALGAGSRFIVTLPGAATAPARPPEDGPATQTVLIADDGTDTVVTAVADYLRANGFEVALARDGHAAKEMAGTLLPAAILMDMDVLDGDGLAAVRSIREAEASRGAHTPIFAFSEIASRDEEQRCRAAGADAYLAKPLRLKALLAAIREQIAARSHTAS